MKLNTQGTDVYVSTDGTTVDKLACVLTIDMGQNSAEQIETTCLSSKSREYVPGLSTVAQITITGAYDTTDLVYEKLLDLATSQKAVDWFIGLSDGTTAPTVTGGVMTPPADRTGYSINAFVASISPQIETNNVVKYSMVLQPSAMYEFNPATAGT